MALSLFVATLTERTVRLWINQGRYIATELEILRLYPPPGSGGKGMHNSARVLVRILATNDELTTTNIPPIHVFDGPDDITGVLPEPETVKGKRFPVWYDANPRFGFSDMRIEYRTEGEPIVATSFAIKLLAAQAAMTGTGLLLTVWGYRVSKRSLKEAK